MKTYKTSRGVEYTLEILSKSSSEVDALINITGCEWATELFPNSFGLPIFPGSGEPVLQELETEIDARIAGEIARRAQVICVRQYPDRGVISFNVFLYTPELTLFVAKWGNDLTATGLSEITELLETLEK